MSHSDYEGFEAGRFTNVDPSLDQALSSVTRPNAHDSAGRTLDTPAIDHEFEEGTFRGWVQDGLELPDGAGWTPYKVNFALTPTDWQREGLQQVPDSETISNGPSQGSRYPEDFDRPYDYRTYLSGHPAYVHTICDVHDNALLKEMESGSRRSASASPPTVRVPIAKPHRTRRSLRRPTPASQTSTKPPASTTKKSTQARTRRSKFSEASKPGKPVGGTTGSLQIATSNSVFASQASTAEGSSASKPTTCGMSSAYINSSTAQVSTTMASATPRLIGAKLRQLFAQLLGTKKRDIIVMKWNKRKEGWTLLMRDDQEALEHAKGLFETWGREFGSSPTLVAMISGIWKRTKEIIEFLQSWYRVSEHDILNKCHSAKSPSFKAETALAGSVQRTGQRSTDAKWCKLRQAKNIVQLLGIVSAKDFFRNHEKSTEEKSTEEVLSIINGICECIELRLKNAYEISSLQFPSKEDEEEENADDLMEDAK